ncbi:Hypothetical protein D9617_2g055840 [Elsinoe fawcettii]|nr:Hypothetical protein D9617_2g055840 [Elsinoe fawcettii]
MNDEDFLRLASPNEQRTITREDLGLYHAVIVGAVYSSSAGFDLTAAASYTGPLSPCIEANPYLAVTVGGTSGDKSWYKHATSVDASRHLKIVDALKSDESSAIQSLLESDLDEPFEDGIPPWRLKVLSLTKSRAFLAFEYSHAIGDGNTGMVFHQQFLSALHSGAPKPPSEAKPSHNLTLPEPFDTPNRLPISWTCLLTTVLDPVLPPSIAHLFGLQTSALPDPSTWTGNAVASSPTNKSKIALFSIPAEDVTNAISLARLHSAKLTGVTQQIILRALSASLPDTKQAKYFIASTALNMRPAVGVSSSEPGNWVSIVDEKHASPPRSGSPSSSSDPARASLSESQWAAAASTTRLLAERAVTLQDQPVGLLRYVSSMRKWTLEKMGGKRGCSFEISNIGVFTPSLPIPSASGSGAAVGEAKGQEAGIEKVIFTQPGAFAGPPLQFNLASVKGGDMVGTVTWSAGALGLGGEGEARDRKEEELVGRVCRFIERDFGGLT